MTPRYFCLFICMLFVGIFILNKEASSSQQYEEEHPPSFRGRLTYFNNIHVQDCLQLGLVYRNPDGSYTIKSQPMKEPWEMKETISVQGNKFTIHRMEKPDCELSRKKWVPDYQEKLNRYCCQFSNTRERPTIKTSEGPLTGTILTSGADHLLVDDRLSSLQPSLRPHGYGFAIFPPEESNSVIQRIEIYPKKFGRNPRRTFSCWLKGTADFKRGSFKLTVLSGYFSVTFASDLLQRCLDTRSPLQGVYLSRSLPYYTAKFFCEDGLQLYKAGGYDFALPYFDVVKNSSDVPSIHKIGCTLYQGKKKREAVIFFSMVVEKISRMDPIPNELYTCLKEATINLHTLLTDVQHLSDIANACGFVRGRGI